MGRGKAKNVQASGTNNGKAPPLLKNCLGAGNVFSKAFQFMSVRTGEKRNT